MHRVKGGDSVRGGLKGGERPRGGGTGRGGGGWVSSVGLVDLLLHTSPRGAVPGLTGGVCERKTRARGVWGIHFARAPEITNSKYRLSGE